MALASSSSQVPGESQHAGAHSGLTHPIAGPPDAAPSASSGEVTGEVPFVSRARCGWCSLILREGVLPETTGICPECLAKQREEDRVRKDRRAQAGVGPCPHGCATAETHTHLDGNEPIAFGPAGDRISAPDGRCAPPAAPVHACVAAYGGFEVVDVNGLAIAKGLSGWNAAVAIATIFDAAIRGYGLCLLHLIELDYLGRCLSCRVDGPRSPFSAVPR